MHLLKAALIGCLVYGLYKLFVFIRRGGAISQPARNATLLHDQIRKVYPKMQEGEARYMTLVFNAAKATRELPKERLLAFVKETEGRPWDTVCEDYAFLWLECVQHRPVSTLPEAVYEKASRQIKEEIRRAHRQIERGAMNYEADLRALPPACVLLMIAEYKVS